MVENHFQKYERRWCCRLGIPHLLSLGVHVISGEGVAIHGAFWHNDFGERRSHGCVNVTPEDAKWIFRWTTPYISLAQSEQRLTFPDHGTMVTVKELKL